MMKGNKGEWSELYTLLKLAADGKLYAADGNINKIESIYYDILQIIRKQKDDNWKYIRNGKIKIISEKTGKIVDEVSISEFKINAEILLKAIQNIKAKKGSFEVKNVENFIKRIKCVTTRAKSTDKADIFLIVHDAKIGSEPKLGFSIKSQLGSPSTLVNASNATNFIYQLSGHKLTDNEKDVFHSFKYFKDKLNYLDKLDTTLIFDKVSSKIFNSNLMLIDTQMSAILAVIVEDFYRGRATVVSELMDLCINKNICDISEDNKQIFYNYKIKEFMTNCALGMMPGHLWSGKYDATGGYIIIKEDGDVLCYHIYNRNEFRDYLYKNTKLDTPSTGKHGFGIIEEVNGVQYLKLNLQIRFIK